MTEATILRIEEYIDHTNLKQDALPKDIENLCNEAKAYNFAAVCINPCFVQLAKEILKNSNCKVCTVVGFPLGQSTTDVKVFEAQKAVVDGADEIDMVINIGRLKNGDFDYVEEDIREVTNAVKAIDNKVCVKVIIECCLLDEDQKKTATLITERAKADYVKTSTGFSLSGATVEDIKLMKKTAGERLRIKGAGGIRDYKTAKSIIDAGADRIGTSNGVAIVKESMA